MEAKEFGNHTHFSNSEVGVEGLKWIPDPGKFRKRKLHFLHYLLVHQHMDTIFHMVLRDKKIDNCKVFADQEDIKHLLHDIHLCLDDIVACLCRVEKCGVGLRL